MFCMEFPLLCLGPSFSPFPNPSNPLGCRIYLDPHPVLNLFLNGLISQ